MEREGQREGRTVVGSNELTVHDETPSQLRWATRVKSSSLAVSVDHLLTVDYVALPVPWLYSLLVALATFEEQYDC